MTDGHSCKRLPVMVQIYQRGRESQHSRNRPKWSEWQRGQFVPDLPCICFHCGQRCSFFHLILGKLTARLQESLGRLIAYIILLGQWPPKNSNSQVAMALILSLVHDE